MSDLSIGDLVGTVSLNDQFSGPINNVAKAVGLSGESFRAMTGAVGLAGAAIVGITGAVVALGTHGSTVVDVQDAFDGLTTAAGSSADVMLGALQEGTLGTISNFELMKAANGALSSGMVKSADDMRTLAAGAKLLADRTGGDTAAAFDTLTSAMATGRTAGLKQMGVFVDTDNAVQAYANSVGKSVGALSAHEVATAKSHAVLAALKTQLDANGPATADFADNIDRGKVAVQNFVDNLSVAVATSPVVKAGMETMGSALQAAFGGSQQDTVKTLMGFVDKFAIGLTYVGQGAIAVASVFVTAWAGIELVVLGVLTAVSAVGTGLVSLVAGLAQLAGEIPGAGALVDGFAVGATNLALAMDDVTKGLFEQAGAANQALAGNSDLQRTLDTMSGSFALARDRMHEVSDAQVDVADAAPKVTKGLQDTAAAATITDAQIKLLIDHAREVAVAMAEMTSAAVTQFLDLQDQMTRANLTGVEARLFDIEQARETELAGIADLQVVWPAAYEEIAALITAKYDQMTLAAQGHFASVELGAANAGFKTRDEQQQMADNAKRLFDEMTSSGKFSEGELKKAHKAYTDAVKAMDDDHALNAMQKFDAIASSASTILSSVFGKNKGAAIAAALIDTSAAIVKVLAQLGWWGIPMAAAIGAQGYAEVQKIRNTKLEGFDQGTVGTMFQDFGRETTAHLHGEEAVVTKRQGATLADMVLGAVRERDDGIVRQLERMEEGARHRDNGLVQKLREAGIFGRATASA